MAGVSGAYGASLRDSSSMAKNIRFQGKFKVGDRVAPSPRCPLWRSLSPNRPRLIIHAQYDNEQQAVVYILGSNNKGKNGHALPFRSYELRPWRYADKRGRPRLVRKYGHKERLLMPALIAYLGRGGYAVETEVPFGNRRIDLVATRGEETLAAELKWQFWKAAIKQAEANKGLTSQSYVVLPTSTAPHLDLDAFRERGIGLMRVDYETPKVKVIVYPKAVGINA